MRVAAVYIALALLAPRAGADVITIVPSRDVTLYQSTTGAFANGRGENVFAGRTQQSLLRRAIFFFNVVGSVPAGATVTSVSLQLSQTNTTGTPNDFTLYRAAANWGEGSSDAGLPGGSGTAAAPGDATWIHTF